MEIYLEQCRDVPPQHSTMRGHNISISLPPTSLVPARQMQSTTVTSQKLWKSIVRLPATSGGGSFIGTRRAFSKSKSKKGRAASSSIKTNQVSPNARRRAQCKGAGGKGKYRDTRNCTTYRRLSENVVATFTWNRNLGNMEAEHPIGPHFPFPSAQSFVPAKHFPFSVPSLLWASTGRMCWKWLPRKCSPHPAFGFNFSLRSTHEPAATHLGRFKFQLCSSVRVK